MTQLCSSVIFQYKFFEQQINGTELVIGERNRISWRVSVWNQVIKLALLSLKHPVK